MYPFERFSEQSKRVLTKAQEEAERSHKTYIGTEHLLIALFQVDGARAPRILADLGVDIASVRSAIEEVLGSDPRIAIRQIIPTARVKKVIEIAFEEARRSGVGHVGTDHLLLALLIEGEGIAARVLVDLGVTQGGVREAMSGLPATELREEARPPETPPPPHPTGGGMAMPDPTRMARGLDDLTAVELLAALLERFGASGPPPPRLLELVVELRRTRHRKRAAVSAEDYDAARRHREAEERLQADATAELEAWRKKQG
ncbi:MAG: hypothetical protein J2P44_03120 [Candidatus Dormibacteraeota bacterium]|nr:hypothetical protein [Candidatus Dormibacteraeota bacterium]